MADQVGLVVEEVCGESGYTHDRRAHANWVNLLHVIDHRIDEFDQERFNRLNSALSQSQWSSVRLLREWWHAEIQEQRLSQYAAHSILVAARLPSAAPIPGIKESSYHRKLYELWQCEFRSLGPDIELNPFRRKAAQVAANQRIAWSCFENLSDEPTQPTYSTHQSQWNFAFPLSAVIATCPWLGPKMNRLPHYLWDWKEQCTVVAADLLPQPPEYIVVSHTWGRWRQTDLPRAEIRGVHWPVPRNYRFDVRMLPTILRETTMPTPYLWIDLFCIPQVEEDDPLYEEMKAVKDKEISQQGEIFRNANRALIWFNDVEDWKALEASVMWLAGTHLKNSRGGRINSISTLERQLQVLQERAGQPTGFLNDYDYTNRGSLEDANPSGWFSSLWTLQEAFLRPDILLVDRNWRLFAVGPNNIVVTLDNIIALVNELEVSRYDNREPISSAQASATPMLSRTIPDHQSPTELYTLSSELLPLPEGDDYEIPPMPRGPEELRSIINKYEMQQMLDAKPATILALANQRYCKHSRAQAIMSVVGATRWYNGHLNRFKKPPCEKSLILGKFPFRFVEEVRKQSGSEFFGLCGSGSESCPAEIFERDQQGRIVSIRIVGSMMPFSSSETFAKRILRFPETAKDHISVATWKVLLDGTCSITQACVIASAKSAIRSVAWEPIQADILMHICNEDPRWKRVRLCQFLRAQTIQLNMYAVIICHGTRVRDCFGLILREFMDPTIVSNAIPHKVTKSLIRYAPPTKILARVGVFRLSDMKTTTPDLPRTWTVDWRVI